MQERIDQELTLLRQRYGDVEYRAEGRWVRVPAYRVPPDWNRTVTDVAFQIPIGYPGTQPYGICVPAGLLFKNEKPNDYVEPADPAPPFDGTWGRFSWTPEGAWQPSTNITAGSNLVNWVVGFADRFREGK